MREAVRFLDDENRYKTQAIQVQKSNFEFFTLVKGKFIFKFETTNFKMIFKVFFVLQVLDSTARDLEDKKADKTFVDRAVEPVNFFLN